MAGAPPEQINWSEPIVPAVSSFTVNAWEKKAVRPQASVTSQVRTQLVLQDSFSGVKLVEAAVGAEKAPPQELVHS